MSNSSANLSKTAQDLLNVFKRDVRGYDVCPKVTIYIRQQYDLLLLVIKSIEKHQDVFLTGIKKSVSDHSLSTQTRTAFMAGFKSVSAHLNYLKNINENERTVNHHISIWLAFLLTTITALHHKYLVDSGKINNVDLADPSRLENMGPDECTCAAYYVVSSMFESQFKEMHKGLKNPDIKSIVYALISLHEIALEHMEQ